MSDIEQSVPGEEGNNEIQEIQDEKINEAEGENMQNGEENNYNNEDLAEDEQLQENNDNKNPNQNQEYHDDFQVSNSKNLEKRADLDPNHPNISVIQQRSVNSSHAEDPSKNQNQISVQTLNKTNNSKKQLKSRSRKEEQLTLLDQEVKGDQVQRNNANSFDPNGKQKNLQKQKTFKKEKGVLIKHNYLLFLREIICEGRDDVGRTIIYYKTGDKNQIECKLRQVIEVPVDQNQVNDILLIKVMMIVDDEEIELQKSIFLNELDLSEQDSLRTYCVFLDQTDQKGQRSESPFAVVFDISLLGGQMEDYPDNDQESIENKNVQKEDVSIIQVAVRDIKNLEQFLKTRGEINQDKFTLSVSKWRSQYQLELKYLKQTYFISLDDPDIEEVYFFFKENIKNPSLNNLTLTLYEMNSESIFVEEFDGRGYTVSQLREKLPIGEAKKVDIKKSLISSDCSALVVNVSFQSKLVVNLKFTLQDAANYQDQFLGYTSMKVLETRIFSSLLEPSQINVQLNSMDKDTNGQEWVIFPFTNLNRFTSTLSTWDHHHNLVCKKNFKKSQENDDPPLNMLIKQKLFQEKDQTSPIVIQYTDVEVDSDFQLFLQNYNLVQSYEPIIKDNQALDFYARKNHMIFKTASPFDYFTMVIYSGQDIIGYYEQSFFQLAENQLQLSYMLKAKKNQQFQSKFLKENTSKPGEVLEDPDQDEEQQEDDEVIGTVKFSFRHHSYNKYLFQQNVWVNELENFRQNSESLTKALKQSTINFAQKYKRISQLKLVLTDVWNLLDLVAESLVGDEFQLRIQLGAISYLIRFQVLKQSLSDFKNSQIINQLDKQNQRHTSIIEKDLLKFYTQNETHIYSFKVDTDISSSLVFQLNSTRDYLILELRNLPQSDLISFATFQIRDLFLIRETGTFALPVKLPKPKASKGNSNCVILFKFSYQIFYDAQKSTFSNALYNIGIFMPCQPIADKSIQKKLKNQVFEFYLQSNEHQSFVSQNLNFSCTNTKLHVEMIPNCEIYQNGELNIECYVKQLYSEDDDEAQGDGVSQPLKSFQINVNSLSVLHGTKNVDVGINRFEFLKMEFNDKTINNTLFFYLYFVYRSSEFIDSPQGNMTITLNQEIQQKMITSNIIDPSSKIIFRYSTRHKQAKKENKLVQEQNYICGSSTKTKLKELTFKTYDETDNLTLEIFNGNVLSESAVVRIANLIMIPYKKVFKEMASSQVLKIQENGSQNNSANESDVNQKQESNGIEQYYWSFVNLQNKKFQIFVQFLPSEEHQNRIETTNTEKDGTQNSEKDPTGADGQNKAKAVADLKKNVNTSQLDQTVMTTSQMSVIELKKQISEVQDQNMNLTTKLGFQKQELEQKFKSIIELRAIEQRSKNPIKSLDHLKQKGISAQALKARQLFNEICSCGQRRPPLLKQKQSVSKQTSFFFRGFCQACIEKMKQEYKNAYQEYKSIADQYETLYTKNINNELKY